LDLTARGKQLFPQILKDYLAADTKLSDYYQYTPLIDSFGEAIENKAKEQIDRSSLVEVLKRQYSGIDDAPVAIDLLNDTKTFTVTTGHQLCLFTGPLYFCYKILTTINLAEQLKEKYPDNNFVPIFWMASEDHDFEEINHFHLFGKKVTWEAEAGNAVGRMSTETLKSVLSDLKTQFESDKTAESILPIFEKAYLEQDNLADATRMLVHSLFGKYGLVVLDADDAALKKTFGMVMKAEIVGQNSMGAMSNAYGSLSKDYKLPVKSRDINLFCFHDNKRNRLEPGSGGAVNVVGSELSFSREECIQMIDSKPESFSPNVVLRPLYQEMVLPNLAYIGGPSEIGYWLELKGIFDENKVSFPVLIPRNSLVVLGVGEVKKMDQFNFSLSDLFADSVEKVKELVRADSNENLSVEQEKSDISHIYNQLMGRAKEIDPSLEASVKADQARALGQLDNLEKKLVKAAKRKNESLVNQANKLFEGIYPSGVFQERYESLFSLLIRYDLGIIDEMKNSIDPFDFGLKILSEIRE